MGEKLYYITDTYETYYALNSANKLVVVSKQEMATKFTLAKANQVIQSVIKPMQRYQYILKEASSNEEETVPVELYSHKYVETRFEEMDTDWSGYLEDLISFSSQLKQYRVNLNYMLSDVDKEICDILHYIEFYNLDAAKGYKVYKMLKDCRMRRRKIKDEQEKATAAISVFANDELIEKMRTALKQMKGLDKRVYEPRVLTELFENAS